MAKQAIKLGLEFDTKAAIQSYRDLVSELSKGGADPKAIKQFTAAIEKAETELAQLAAEGSTGFTDSKSMEQYQKKVLKTVTSMQQLALRMQEFSKSGDNFPTSEVKKLEAEIEKLKKKITEAQKAAKEGLVKNLVIGGFSKKEAEAIAETVKSQEELIARLEEERKIRAAINEETGRAAKTATSRALRKEESKMGAKSDIVNSVTGMQGKKGVTDARVIVAEAMKQGLREGFDGAKVKERALQLVEESNLEKELKAKISKGLEEGFDVEGVDNYLNGIRERIEQLPSVIKHNNASKNLGKIANGKELKTDISDEWAAQTEIAAKAQEDLAEAQEKSAQAALNSESAQKKCGEAAAQEANKAEQAANGFLQMSDAQKESQKSAEQLEGGFNRLADRLKYMFGFTAMFNRLRQIIRSTFNDIQELDKAYASIAYVTNETVGDLWKTYDEYAGMAEKLGQSTADVIKASAIYRQQGLNTEEALELTTDTMKLATIAGNDYATATQEMTAALRGFKMEMDEGGHVADVYSELAAHAAARVDDIAQAMSRTASIANSAGMSFENTSAFLTQMIETTQESAENIGTSMKTIIARFTELKKNVAGTEESEFDDLDFNKVDQALKSVGISLKDTYGQFRNLDEVFLELSGKWDTLDRNTQRYIATVAAGSRQQSRFIAMMDNYERTVELIDIAADSEGKADEQFAKAADTIEFKLNAIKTKWQELKLEIMDSGFVKGLLDKVNSVMDGLKNLKMPQLAFMTPFAIMTAKNFILNFIKTIKGATNSWKQVGSNISNTIVKAFGKTSFNIKIENLNKITANLEAERKNIQAKLDANPIKIKSEVNEQSYVRLDNALQKLANSGNITVKSLNELKQSQDIDTESADILGQAMLQLDEKDEALIQKLRELIEQYKNLTQAQRTNEEQTKKNAATSQMTKSVMSGLSSGFSSVGSAATIAFTAMASGMGVITSLNSATMMLQTQLITLGFKIIPQIVTFIVEGSAEAAAAIASTGIGALVVGLGIALTQLTKFTIKALEAKKAQAAAATSTVSLSNSIAMLKEKQEELNKALSEQKEKTKEAKDAYDKLNEGYKEFKKYEALIVKTDEAEEDWLKTSQDIAELIPDLIDHYDEEGNAILTNLEGAWVKALQAKKDYYNEQSVEEARTEFSTNANLYATNKLEVERLKEQERLKNAGEYDVVEAFSRSTKTEQNWSPDWGQGLAWDNNKLVYNPYPNGSKKDEEKISETRAFTAANIANFAKNAAYEDWELIKSALLKNPSTAKIFGIDENTKVENIGAILDKKFSNGASKKDLDAFNAAINNYFKTQGTRIQEAESAMTSSEKKVEDSINNFISKAANGNDIYDKYDKNVQQIIAQYIQNGLNINFEDIQNRAIKQVRDKNSDWFDSNGEIKATYRDLYEDEVLANMSSIITDITNKTAVDEQINKLTNSELEFLSKLSEKVTKDGIDIIQQMQEVSESKILSEEAKQAWYDQNSSKIEDLKESANKFAQSLDLEIKNFDKETGEVNFGDENINNFYNALNAVARDKIQETFAKIANEKGTSTAKHSFASYSKATEGISSDAQAFLLGQDWSMFEAFNSEAAVLDELRNEYGLTTTEAKNLFEATKSLNIATGDYNKTLESGGVLDFKEKITGFAAALEKERDVFRDYLLSGQTTIDVTKDYDKIQKSLANLAKENINISEDVAKWDAATGKYLLDVEKLKSEFARYTTNASDYYNKQIEIYKNRRKINGQLTEDEERALKLLEENKAMVEGITSVTADLLGLTNSIANNIERVGNEISSVSSIIEQYNKDGSVSVENLAKIQSLIKDENLSKYVDNNLRLNKKALLEFIDAEIDYLETLDSIDSAQELELLQLKALRKEWENTKTELNTSSLEDRKKAMEDYAKAQEDVIEKQKALNEAIEEYNKLLYGSDNRNSGLDLLYNYKEAISAFSDEMSRAQDILEDSSSVNDAINALQKYTSAAHSRLAWLGAQSNVYDQGLNERRNNLLNNSTSYDDERTGKRTTIKFSDYVKYNANTGLMSINQSLIQNAKIADHWKDYIEKQVDDYNKLYQENLKNQDEIRKLEKEIQKRREDAIKKYADFEKDIAETLKSVYQEQVDNLKEKYDSMKEADDDYVNALQEAIEKQRKLRDRENKWEELAQKEKKLSLMSRDTSGANALETQKLEKEVQKDREQLLDESIDSVIENMQKLAEKQDELRQVEIELKEALLDNTAYWNQQAEQVASGFQTAEDYVEWFKNTAAGLNEQTAAQFEVTMNEAREKFNEASEAIAWNIMDDMELTGDSVEQTINITAQEIKDIVNSTSTDFITAVKNTFETTKTEFNKNMDSAIEKVNSATKAYDEACGKARELANEINKIVGKDGFTETPEKEWEYRPSTIHSAEDAYHVYADQTLSANLQPKTDKDYMAEAYSNFMGQASKIQSAKGLEKFKEDFIKESPSIKNYPPHYHIFDSYGTDSHDAIKDFLLEYGWSGKVFYLSTEDKFIVTGDNKKKSDIKQLLDGKFSSDALHEIKAYAQGGMVNYTGPAWVDGSPQRPEAFLSAEDTERIGNAAKLLADIPSLNQSNISTTNASYGDTNVEINLNIDHISSDVDIDTMLERVKTEIVDIARPIGTNVILHQQV